MVSFRFLPMCFAVRQALKNAAAFIQTGEEPECKPYAEGEAEELAERFGITLTYNVPPEPVDPDGEYAIEEMLTSTILEYPGRWGYSWQGRSEAKFDQPQYSKGVITWSVQNYQRDDSQGINDNMIFRYQPDLPVGTKYRMQFTVKFDGVDRDDVYIKFGNEWYSSLANPGVSWNDDGSFTVDYTGTVGADYTFLIQVTAANGAGEIAFDMTVSDIKLSAIAG